MDRGARVAETGSLLSISRSRAGSQSLAAPVEAAGGDERGEVHEDAKDAAEV
jgi:hypothetical protein